MKPRILVIEDNARLRNGLIDQLKAEGFEAFGAGNGDSGVKCWQERKPDLVLLDLMLPGRDGYRVLTDMRSSNDYTPVIMLTALGEEWQRVKGFRLGADDYVVKPFGMNELIERIRAVLRRSGFNHKAENEVTSYAGISLDPSNRCAHCKNTRIELPGILFPLLAFFLNRPEELIERDQLLSTVWGVDSGISTRTVDVHISKLRKLLRDSQVNLVTIRGKGYMLSKC